MSAPVSVDCGGRYNAGLCIVAGLLDNCRMPMYSIAYISGDLTWMQ
jgi:hypothetical protein